MAIKSVVVGKGTLTLAIKGGSSSSLDFSAQITSAKFQPDSSTGETITVLSGETIPGKKSFGGHLEVDFLQDFSTNGIVDFSYKNAGKEADFVYTPNTAAKAKLSGTVIITPLEVGDDVEAIAKSAAKWAVPALPTFTPGSS